MLIAHHPHFPELGVRRLGEGAEGNGGPRTLEADIQVKQITQVCAQVVLTKKH